LNARGPCPKQNRHVNHRENSFPDKKYCYCREINAAGNAIVKVKPKKTKSSPARSKLEELRTGSNAPLEVGGSLESKIGNEVRQLRKELELTVAELSTSAGISTGMLSKIETGSISASLGTLNALSKALNVPISRFFRETEEERDCSFVKAGTGVKIERRGTKSGHHYQLLGQSIHGELGVEPYLITLNEDAEAYSNFRHAGVEMIYMLTGKVRYRHADQTYLMEPGDTLFFDAAARHGPEELVKAPMTYLSVIIYPRRS
jgi:transcriptional regulator with XRE-family HTH domain